MVVIYDPGFVLSDLKTAIDEGARVVTRLALGAAPEASVNGVTTKR